MREVLAMLFSFLLLGLTFNPLCFGLVIVEEFPAKIFHQPRRSFLRETLTRIGSTFAVASSPACCFPLVSVAQEEEAASAAAASDAPDKGGKRPFAPLEALLPAARLKVSIDKVHSLSSTLTTATDKSVQYETLVKMNQILAETQGKLFVTESPFISQRRNRPSVSKEQQFNPIQPDNLSVPDRLNAMFTRSDMERQWGILQYQESKREKGNEMRAAFNYYTSRLEFGDSYLLTAQKEERKRMIRNEQLPSLVAVITSDLDMRDLYRNQFLTLIEDAKAEISYQLRQPVELVDTTDVVNLMNQAQTVCNQWFALIAPQDVQDAMNVVLNE